MSPKKTEPEKLREAIRKVLNRQRGRRSDA